MMNECFCVLQPFIQRFFKIMFLIGRRSEEHLHQTLGTSILFLKTSANDRKVI